MLILYRKKWYTKAVVIFKVKETIMDIKINNKLNMRNFVDVTISTLFYFQKSKQY